jgi:clathrin heavy chain
MELWAKVLQPAEGGGDTAHRRSLIDQVVQTALPETKNPDEVSTTVKAFMQADLPEELIELLERIVLQGSEFSNNSNLQNLLILTAMRVDKERVMDYINRLDNFDGPDIAALATTEQYELYEEAFVIYTKTAKKSTNPTEKLELNVHAIEVLVDHLRNLDRAKEFAARVNEPTVWSKLAKAQLDEDMVTEAIQSYIKAKDASHYTEVIHRASRTGLYSNMIPYLKMARVEIKEALLDTELIYSYAKSNQLSDLEEFISAPNIANIQEIGERCFDEGMYEAAKILFANINNNAKLALCFINLSLFREAVDAAQKANSVSTWKEVNIACVKAKEFRLAAMCGLHIIVHPDHLEELILHYERAGHPDELINLMETGLGAEGAHAGVYTELGILYSKYKPEKLMEHIKIMQNSLSASLT